MKVNPIVFATILAGLAFAFYAGGYVAVVIAASIAFLIVSQ